jgi:hypothetical protein
VQYFYRVSVNGEAYTGSFLSAPAENASEISFFAYGDTRTYPADHNDVASAMVSTYLSDPEYQTLVLCVGDLISDGDIEYDWDAEFFSPFYGGIQAMLANLPYQSAMGNHEGTGRLFEDYFPYPFVAGRYWSFDYGPAHFAIVDQYTPYNSGSAQHTWLDNDLAATDRPWKFVCLHEPGWSAGGHSNSVYVQNYIQPLLETHDVSILFAGHNHYYARAIKNGVQHVTTGGGGAPLYTPDPEYPNVVAAERAHHFCEVEIDGPSLSFRAVTPAGAVIDSFVVEHPWLDAESEEVLSRLDGGVSARVSPNPFRSVTRLSFSLSKSSGVELDVYDVCGRKVTTLLTGRLEAGKHDAEWDCKDLQGRPVGSGIYFYRLRAGEHVTEGKMVLLR